ncbi:hypothetical protein A1O1_03007 [Capronia coronata CBS 617.96]|uniref:Beta-lactamase-related domain-containing protein n=1 Tax=Capronia coronata CBS 617.96 TaxID=1182541 RepID=W9YZ91_9EURO|nr:uncharacterized protein A1O1_03007 [Capronia coronata CBS 617.96]EXJ94611.1 hypothetical protein A1O1_03007 [Capronia coronata CBS 617.96]
MAPPGESSQVIEDMSVPSSHKPSVNGHHEEKPAVVKKSPLNSSFENIVRDTLEKWHIQGMSVAVIEGEDIWTEGYGFATLPDVPVRASTLFHTGSTTKSFLAAAVSLVVHDNDKYGHVQWDTPISELIREDFVLEDEYATSRVTIEDALSHRTGMPGHTLTFGGDTLKESVRSLRHLYLNKAIRTTWQYCNLMYMAVSHMMEVVTRTWLGDFLREKIWEPLGMKQTFFRLSDAEKYLEQGQEQDCNLAIGYSWDEQSAAARPVPLWRDAVVSGAGAIISNVVDYAKYVRSMIHQSGPLPKQAYLDLATPRSIMPPFDPHFRQPLLYSLGWINGIYHGESVVTHGGGLDGFSSVMMYLPDREFGVVIFANGQTRGTEVPAWFLIDNLLGVPEEERLDLFEWNAKALAEAKRQIADAPGRLYPSAPNPPLPLSLPLSEYSGTYSHPAYRPFVITPSTGPQSALRAVAEGLVKVVLNLRHVTGEYFVANLILFTHGTEPVAALKAQFQLDVQGRVNEFGAELDFLSGGGKMIWFKRCDKA